MKKTRTYSLGLAAVLTAALMSATVMGAAVTFAGESEVDPNYEPAPVIDYSDYGYQENGDGTVTITEYNGSEEEVVIPAELDGHKVTSIGSQAFAYKEMASLTIPEEISEIGMRAFEYCTVTDEFVLPKNITILSDAFSYAKLPEMITIPEGAVLKSSSFGYFNITKMVVIETGVVVEGDAFEYSKALEMVICEAGATLENEAFDSCSKLEEAVLCGDVKTSGEPFYSSDNVEITLAEEDEFEALAAELQAKAAETAGLYKYIDGKMSFYLPRGMISMYNAEFDITAVNSEDTFMLGTIEYPDPSGLDFSKDEDIQIMVDTAKDYVAVDGAYKVTVCGYPAVWINIHDTEDTNIGAYLYFSTPANMYYLMYVSVVNSYQEFIDMVNTIAIDGVKEGTDLSGLPE